MRNLLIIFMALATFGMNAQNNKLEKREHRKEMKSNLTPQQRVDLKLKKMTSALDLNPYQQEKMKEFFLENRNDRSEMYKNRKGMTEAQSKEAKSAMMDRRVSFKTQMKEILTEEQMTKWEGLKNDRRNKSKEREMRKSSPQH